MRNIKVRAETASARDRAQRAIEEAFDGTLSGAFGGGGGEYWIDMILPDGVSFADAEEAVAAIPGVTVEER